MTDAISARDLVRRALAEARTLGRVYVAPKAAALLEPEERVGTTDDATASAEAAVVIAEQVAVCGAGQAEPFPPCPRVFAVVADGPVVVPDRAAAHTREGITDLVCQKAVLRLGGTHPLVREVVRGLSARALQRELGVPLSADETLRELTFPS